MEADFKRVDGVVVVELKGRLDLESGASLREACLGRWLQEKVVFDLNNLNFVGSLGLQTFVDTLDHMSAKSGAGVRIFGVSSEFRRLFEATGVAARGICSTRDEAMASLAVDWTAASRSQLLEP